jgi:hypothetical protein
VGVTWAFAGGKNGGSKKSTGGVASDLEHHVRADGAIEAARPVAAGAGRPGIDLGPGICSPEVGLSGCETPHRWDADESDGDGNGGDGHT